MGWDDPLVKWDSGQESHTPVHDVEKIGSVSQVAANVQVLSSGLKIVDRVKTSRVPEWTVVNKSSDQDYPQLWIVNDDPSDTREAGPYPDEENAYADCADANESGQLWASKTAEGVN